jgi:hypothetical protein
MVWACIAAQLYGFIATTRRFTVGTAGTLNPFSFLVHPTWSPPLAPPLIDVALVTAALLVLGVLATKKSEAPGDTGLPLSSEPVPLPHVGVSGLR